MSALVSLLHLFYLAGAIIAGIVGLMLAFGLNRRWVFRDVGGYAWPQLAKHVLVVAVGIALGTLLLWLGVSQLSLPYQIGWLASGTIVFFGWTFPMQRFFTFRAQPAPAI